MSEPYMYWMLHVLCTVHVLSLKLHDCPTLGALVSSYDRWKVGAQGDAAGCLAPEQWLSRLEAEIGFR